MKNFEALRNLNVVKKIQAVPLEIDDMICVNRFEQIIVCCTNCYENRVAIDLDIGLKRSANIQTDDSSNSFRVAVDFRAISDALYVTGRSPCSMRCMTFASSWILYDDFVVRIKQIYR